MKRILCLAIVLTMTFATVSCLSETIDPEKPFSVWFDHGLGSYIPDPNNVLLREVTGTSGLKINKEKMFSDQLDNITEDEFLLYSEACFSYGFDKNVSQSLIEYSADNEEGVHLSLLYFAPKLIVKLDRKS